MIFTLANNIGIDRADFEVRIKEVDIDKTMNSIKK